MTIQPDDQPKNPDKKQQEELNKFLHLHLEEQTVKQYQNPNSTAREDKGSPT